MIFFWVWRHRCWDFSLGVSFSIWSLFRGGSMKLLERSRFEFFRVHLSHRLLKKLGSPSVFCSNAVFATNLMNPCMEGNITKYCGCCRFPMEICNYHHNSMLLYFQVQVSPAGEKYKKWLIFVPQKNLLFSRVGLFFSGSKVFPRNFWHCLAQRVWGSSAWQWKPILYLPKNYFSQLCFLLLSIEKSTGLFYIS